MEVSLGTLDSQVEDYAEDCARLTAVERLALVQRLRIQFWGDDAAGRLSRLSSTTEEE